MSKQELFFAKEPKITKQEEIDSIDEYYAPSNDADNYLSSASAAMKAEKEAEERIRITKEYHQMLNKYKDIELELRKNLARINDLNRDNISSIISKIDKERHELHLAVIATAAKLGKNEKDVLVDIVREDKTLEEYGLPEFSIFNGYDILSADDWYQPLIVNAGIGTRQGRYLPESRRNNTKMLEHAQEHNYKPIIPADSFMLAFDVSWIDNNHLDYELRKNRAIKLAEQLNGLYTEGCDSCYHEGRVSFNGVIFKNDKFEEVINYIRNNESAFRLGREFYSAKENELLEKKWATIKNHNDNTLKKLAITIEKYKNILKEKTGDVENLDDITFDPIPDEYDHDPLYSLLPEIEKQLDILEEINYLKKNNQLKNKNIPLLLDKLNDLSLQIKRYFKS